MMARDNRRMRNREEVAVEHGRYRQNQQRQRNYRHECLNSRGPKPKETSTTAEFRRWSKGFCGCLIVLGIVFVFYVITTLIIDNSSPFDFIFSQHYGKGMMQQGREAELHAKNVMSSSGNINESSKIIVSEYKTLIWNRTDDQDLNQDSENESAILVATSSYEGRAKSTHFPASSEGEDLVKGSLKNKRQEPESLKPSNEPSNHLNTHSILENGRRIGMAESLHKPPLYAQHKYRFYRTRPGHIIRDKLRNNHRMPIYKRSKNEEEMASRRRPPIPLIESRSFQKNPISQDPKGQLIPHTGHKSEIILRNPPRGLSRGFASALNSNFFRPYKNRRVSSLSSPYTHSSEGRYSLHSPPRKLLHEREFYSSRLSNRRKRYPSYPHHKSYPVRRRRPVRDEYQKLIAPERFRYPPTATSIQDIIGHMSGVKVSKPKLTHRNTQEYSLKSFHSRHPPEFILGAQDHILAHDSSGLTNGNSWHKAGVNSDLRIFPDSYENVNTFLHTNAKSHFNTEQNSKGNIRRTPSNSGNTGQVLPPVQNVYNPNHYITPKISRPLELRLDIYPKTDFTSGSEDLQTYVSVGDNTAERSHSSAINSQIILHLNFFSRAPSHQPQSRQSSSQPESEIALEIPLRGHPSPLDIYKWVVRAAKTLPIAYPHKGISPDEDNEGQIGPFYIEPGPALYAVIERGLREINLHLPPERRIIFNQVSEEELLNLKNGPEDWTP